MTPLKPGVNDIKAGVLTHSPGHLATQIVALAAPNFGAYNRTACRRWTDHAAPIMKMPATCRLVTYEPS